MNLQVYQSIIDHASDAIVVTKETPAGPAIVFTNNAYTEMTGYSKAEVLGKNPKILQGAETDQKELDKLRVALAAKKPGRAELVNYRKNGEKFWTDISIFPVTDRASGLSYWIGIKKDITELKDALEQLYASNEWYRKMLQEGIDLITILDADGNLTYVSPSSGRILGYEPEELAGKDAFMFVHPDDLEIIREKFEALKTSDKYDSQPYRVFKKDGTQLWMRSIGTNMLGDPHINGIVLNSFNVSREHYLGQLEKLEKELLEKHAANISFREILDQYLQGVEALHEGMMCSMLELRDGHLYNLSSPSIPEDYIRAIEGMAIGENEGSCGTAAFLKKPVIAEDTLNDPRWEKYREPAEKHNLRACWSHPIISRNGHVMATLAIYYSEPGSPDDNELKTIERAVNLLGIVIEKQRIIEKLKRSNERYRAINNAINESIWEYHIARDIARLNENFHATFGYPETELENAYEWWKERVHPDDLKSVLKELNAALRNGRDRFEVRSRFRTASGRYKHILNRCHILRDPHGRPLSVLGATRDITPIIESKQREDGFRETILQLAKNYRVISGDDLTYSLEQISRLSARALGVERVNIWEINGGVLHCICSYDRGDMNERRDETLHMEKDYPHYFAHLMNSRNVVIDDTATDERCRETAAGYYLPNGVCSAIDQPVILGGEHIAVICIEQQHKLRTWHSSEVSFVGDIGDMITQVFANAQIREKDRTLQRSLEEKETLITEIHHRVKNNLAIISGMMQLQSFEEADERVRRKLLETTSRIRTMADIHEILYKSPSFTHIDIHDAIQTLSSGIMEMLKPEREIRLHLDLRDTGSLNINQAIPFSLLFNEVYTNIFKHAFKGQAECEIRIALRRKGDRISFTLTDNGQGLPEGFDIAECKTTGMELVRTLTSQLGATCRYSRLPAGTEFSLEFPRKDTTGSQSGME